MHHASRAILLFIGGHCSDHKSGKHGIDNSCCKSINVVQVPSCLGSTFKHRNLKDTSRTPWLSVSNATDLSIVGRSQHSFQMGNHEPSTVFGGCERRRVVKKIVHPPTHPRLYRPKQRVVKEGAGVFDMYSSMSHVLWYVLFAAHIV